MRALVLLTNPIESPGERYRFYQYLPYLEKAGIDCHVNALLSSRSYRAVSQGGSPRSLWSDMARGGFDRLTSLIRRKEFDVAFIYRIPVFISTTAVRFLLQSGDVPYVVDFDDAIFLRSPDPSSRLTGFLKAPDRLGPLLEDARLTTVGNDYLAQHARRFSSSVEVIPTCVNTNRFSLRPPARDTSSVVVGWIGSRSTVPYLRLLDPVWPAVATAGNPKFVLSVVGGSHKTPNVETHSEPWRLEREKEVLRTFDIGVMPLPDDEWSKGKCGLKILQYMATGVPVVASRVGVNPQIIRDGENGFLASSIDEWTEKLLRLASDPDLRTSMGRAGRATIESDYSLNKWGPRLAELIVQAAGVSALPPREE